jgi:hypothetical protein
MRRFIAVAGVFLWVGCASAPARPAGPRLWQLRLPAQTSIDLLLGSTVSLDLTTPQVAELVKLQAELNEKVKPIRDDFLAARNPSQVAAPPPQAGAPPPPPPPEMPPGPPVPIYGPGHWVGEVRSSGDVGVPRGERPRGPKDAQEPMTPDYVQRRAKLEGLIKQFDQEDQAAYARAEALFDGAQKEAARKLMAQRAADRAKQNGG